MLQGFKDSVRAVAAGLGRLALGIAAAAFGARVFVVLVIAFAAAGYAIYRHPPLKSVARGELGIRVNRLTGEVEETRDASVLVLPGLHELRVFSVRYALDVTRLRAVWSNLPENLDADLVQPAVASVMYKVFARYTVREIFSTKRAEIRESIETELRAKLAADGVALRDVLIGKVDLPSDYRRGMEALLAEELASEKMRYTLELKEKRVKETELEGEAARVRREKAAEAAALEQLISARSQDEAMRHVLPFKQRQVEQRRLEAEAERVANIRRAQGNAQARRIEADGEAKARQRLAEAEAYRLEKVGKANAEQMEREGALVSRHPLLIQKTLADKLSDKIQVIIAPPPADQGFIGATLLGGGHKP